MDYESIGINETLIAPKKQLKYVMNLLGKIVNPETILGDVILLYVYDDGSVEKKSIRYPTVIRVVSGNIGFIRC